MDDSLSSRAASAERAITPTLSVVSGAEHDLGSRSLSAEALRTLRQLERRIRTGHLDAVNLRQAGQLAELGLAKHGRGGWTPTPEGLTYLGAL